MPTRQTEDYSVSLGTSPHKPKKTTLCSLKQKNNTLISSKRKKTEAQMQTGIIMNGFHHGNRKKPSDRSWLLGSTTKSKYQKHTLISPDIQGLNDGSCKCLGVPPPGRTTTENIKFNCHLMKWSIQSRSQSLQNPLYLSPHPLVAPSGQQPPGRKQRCEMRFFNLKTSRLCKTVQISVSP